MNIDRHGILEDLRGKRQAYDDAIKALEHARGLIPADGNSASPPRVAMPAPAPAVAPAQARPPAAWRAGWSPLEWLNDAT